MPRLLQPSIAKVYLASPLICGDRVERKVCAMVVAKVCKFDQVNLPFDFWVNVESKCGILGDSDAPCGS